ncbi:MAG: PAS domain S-box protein [Phycisphaeraceae bacterium]
MTGVLWSAAADDHRPSQTAAIEAEYDGMFAVLQALAAPAALLDEAGCILACNSAWRSPHRVNPLIPVDAAPGECYADWLADLAERWTSDPRQARDSARQGEIVEAAEAIHTLLTGERSRYTHRYACHTSSERHWCEFRGSRVAYADRTLVLIVHENVTERVLIAEALAESDHRFSLLTQAIDQITWEWDIRQDRIIWTGPVRERLGYDHVQMGTTMTQWHRHAHPDDRSSLEQALVIFLHGTETQWQHEYRLIRSDASQATFLEQAVLLRDARNRPLKMIGTATDITRNKHIERTVRESEGRYRSLIENAPDALLVVQDDKIVLANRAYAQLLNMNDPAEAIGRSPLEFVDPAFHETVRQRIRAMHGSGKPAPLIRERMIRLDGGQVDVEVTSSPCTYHGKPAVQAFLRNVTKRVRIERALRESEQRFRRLADAAPVLIWLSGPDGESTYFNWGWLAFRGRSLEQEAGSGWASGIHPEDYQMVVDQHAAALTRRQQFRIEYRLRRHDGVYRWILVHAVPLHDDDGIFAGFIGSCIDITDRKRSERRQKLLVDELDHRVKNTLATVLALAQQQFARKQSVDDFRQSFIGRLHAMSRTHEALARTRWDGVNLDDIVQMVLAPYLQGRVEQIKTAGPVTKLPARAALPISLSLHELATNAMKYGGLSTPRGEVRITWQHSEQGIEIEWREHGSTPGKINRPGTGMQLIEGLISYELQGSVHFDFANEGMECIMKLPLP